jgi:Kazal-type serine protease inhibitor domain
MWHRLGTACSDSSAEVVSSGGHGPCVAGGMTQRSLASILRNGFQPVAGAWFCALALLAGCGGSAAFTDAGNGVAGAAGSGSGNAGSGNTGSGNAGSGNAGSGNAGSGNAGSGNAGSGNAGAGNAGAGTTGTTCTVGGKTYPSGTGGFLGPDGCNHCSCFDGQLACTDLACNPPPPKLCGGIAGIACDKGQYCKYPDAQCAVSDLSGECTSDLGGCTADYAPVCGCDGKPYGNACAARVAGVNVAHTGLCDAAPPGSCSVTPDGVLYPDGATNIPAGDGCNVCTCTTGALSCSARPCKAPTACGARAGNTCAAAEYCAYTPGAACGAADAESVCRPRPTECSTIYQPVCGCDGITYANTCLAALAGSGVVQTGVCGSNGRSCVVGALIYPDGAGNIPAPDGCNTCACSNGTLACTKKACLPPKICGGISGAQCATTEYCAYVEGQSCGAGDLSSTCLARPDLCSDIADPVCGCDGTTYPNSCAAGQAGVGYSYKGACVPCCKK